MGLAVRVRPLNILDSLVNKVWSLRPSSQPDLRQLKTAILLLQVEWPCAGHTLAQDISLSNAHQVTMKPLRHNAPIWTAGIASSVRRVLLASLTEDKHAAARTRRNHAPQSTLIRNKAMMGFSSNFSLCSNSPSFRSWLLRVWTASL